MVWKKANCQKGKEDSRMVHQFAKIANKDVCMAQQIAEEAKKQSYQLRALYIVYLFTNSSAAAL